MIFQKEVIFSVEPSILEESIDEPLPSTSRGKKGKIPKIKKERVNERQKKIFRQKEVSSYKLLK